MHKARTRKSFGTGFRLGVAGACCFLQWAQAVDRQWINPAGGLFTEPANWSGQAVPGPADNAVFNLASVAGYNVTLRTSQSNNRLFVRNDTVTLVLSGTAPVVYSLSSSAAAGVVVGDIAGDSAELTLRSGTVLAVNTVVGNSGSAAGELRVRMPGTIWTSSGLLTVGYAGSGAMTILRGGCVNSGQGRIGSQPGSAGNVTVQDVGSAWNVTGQLLVGENGEGSLAIVDGGSVRAGSAVVAASGAGSLVVANGGRFESTSFLTLGAGALSTATVTAQAGGMLQTQSATLAAHEDSAAWATLDGAETAWTVAGNVDLGYAGIASIEIRGGARMAADSASIGVLGQADGTALVADAGSAWEVGGHLVVGRAGSADLGIEAGGRVTSASATVGQDSDSFGSVYVAGAGSEWKTSGNLVMGGAGTGIVDLREGAVLRAATCVLGSGVDGGGLVSVADGSLLAVMDGTGPFVVGQRGAGTALVEGGGTVSCGTAQLGVTMTGYGEVEVGGAGSVWKCQSMHVGGDAAGPMGTGIAAVHSGGKIEASGVLTVWETGTLAISQGSVAAERVELLGGLLLGSGELQVPVMYEDAQIDVDADQAFVLSGGTSASGTTALHKTGRGELTISGPQEHGSSMLQVHEGTLRLASDAGAGGGQPTIRVEQGARLDMGASQHLAELHIGPDGAAGATMASEGPSKLLVVQELTVGPDSWLDLGDNDLILRGAGGTGAEGLRQMEGYVRGGYLRSSMAQANPLTGLAVILNDDGSGQPIWSQFAGEMIDEDCVLVAYVWDGDMNLDGRINADDYFWIDRGFLSQSRGYRNGDLNYDGKINADDYYLIDRAFLGQTGVLGTRLAVREPVVPEPATGVLLAGAIAMAGARRRRR